MVIILFGTIIILVGFILAEICKEREDDRENMPIEKKAIKKIRKPSKRFGLPV